jgi:hypothetical protein
MIPRTCGGCVLDSRRYPGMQTPWRKTTLGVQRVSTKVRRACRPPVSKETAQFAALMRVEACPVLAAPRSRRKRGPSGPQKSGHRQKGLSAPASFLRLGLLSAGSTGVQSRIPAASRRRPYGLSVGAAERRVPEGRLTLPQSSMGFMPQRPDPGTKACARLAGSAPPDTGSLCLPARRAGRRESPACPCRRPERRCSAPDSAPRA